MFWRGVCCARIGRTGLGCAWALRVDVSEVSSRGDVEQPLDAAVRRGRQQQHPADLVVPECGRREERVAAEEPLEVGLPLRHEVRRRHDDRLRDVPEALSLAQAQPGHDRLAVPGSSTSRNRSATWGSMISYTAET